MLAPDRHVEIPDEVQLTRHMPIITNGLMLIRYLRKRFKIKSTLDYLMFCDCWTVGTRHNNKKKLSIASPDKNNAVDTLLEIRKSNKKIQAPPPPSGY